MTAAAAPVLHLERPAFWTESSDAEVWFRALDAIARAAQRAPQTGTPRTVAERCLVGIIAWRGATGLFGAFQRGGLVRLPGVGLIACDADGSWDITDEAHALLRHWKEAPRRGLELLAAILVRESPWLRLMLLRLQNREWELTGWSEVRSSRGGLKVGRSILLRAHSEPERWFEGLERPAAARWLARTNCKSLNYAPEVLTRKTGKDDLSVTPLTAPLHLLESVGWLTRTGQLTLPSEIKSDLACQSTPMQVLTEITSRHADVRGFVAAEPVLRELLATFGMSPSGDAFARWMDALIDQAVQRGAIEVLDAEPGQARHGRGLHADPARKLVRWVIHSEFNDAFQNTWGALETKWEPAR
ncbi:hypothetical protein [Bradyrhizobium sp. SZCCHNR1015]|uniref:hypothetical protein n=1 Tax=Bradyrhizobium sp. SZCCHNR1015 TaxID=3057338 RepID=UPI0029163ED1|nr:hypothetical protein [Bradyrhizobium sp. SZCCHNR1015]